MIRDDDAERLDELVTRFTTEEGTLDLDECLEMDGLLEKLTGGLDTGVDSLDGDV